MAAAASGGAAAGPPPLTTATIESVKFASLMVVCESPVITNQVLHSVRSHPPLAAALSSIRPVHNNVLPEQLAWGPLYSMDYMQLGATSPMRVLLASPEEAGPFMLAAVLPTLLSVFRPQRVLLLGTCIGGPGTHVTDVIYGHTASILQWPLGTRKYALAGPFTAAFVALDVDRLSASQPVEIPQTAGCPPPRFLAGTFATTEAYDLTAASLAGCKALQEATKPEGVDRDSYQFLQAVNSYNTLQKSYTPSAIAVDCMGIIKAVTECAVAEGQTSPNLAMLRSHAITNALIFLAFFVLPREVRPDDGSAAVGYAAAAGYGLEQDDAKDRVRTRDACKLVMLDKGITTLSTGVPSFPSVTLAASTRKATTASAPAAGPVPQIPLTIALQIVDEAEIAFGPSECTRWIRDRLLAMRSQPRRSPPSPQVRKQTTYSLQFRRHATVGRTTVTEYPVGDEEDT